MKPTQYALLIIGVCAAAPLAATAQEGQRSAPPAGTLVGKVLDAGSGQPVPAAVVTIEPASAGLIVDPRSATPFASTRTVITGDGGAYRFADVLPGKYRMRVERVGYRAVTLEVDVRRPVQATVSVGLELEPVTLEPMRIDQRATSLFHRTKHGMAELDEARVSSERARQALFLQPDSRTLTYADVMDGVTLGEGDVFRALQRFPGVDTRDDYSAELWTRGAPWTQTRVTFDGVPLFNPVHAVGILSAITPEVLGAVFFHPGVRPAAFAEGAAGVIDLRSRAGAGTGALRGVADVSMATAKIELEQHIDRRGSWLVAARRSHLGVLTEGLNSLGLDTVDLPYLFHDVAGRADIELGAHAHLEASGLWEQDRIEGDVEGVLERTRARWGNTAGRVTLRTTFGSVVLAHTLGASGFSARTDERVVRTRDPAPSWTEPASDNQIRYEQFAGELTPVAGDRPARWSAGYDVAWQSGHYDGPVPRYYAVKPDTVGRLQSSHELRVIGIWSEARVDLGSHFSFNPGVRVETGGEFADAPAVRAAPRMAARYALSRDQSVSFAIGRSWQYVQAIGLAGPSIHPAFHATHFWLWPDERTPALRADIASIGSERWLGNGWLASANAFARHATGLTVPDPTPGKLGRRPVFVRGENIARGIELGMRRIGAQWSASFGYTYGKSDVEVAHQRYPSPADRRHTVDAMLSTRIARTLRIAAAFTSMSGAPFTRAYAVTRQGCTDLGFGCSNPDGSYVQEPNAERTPPYRALDASLQWTRAFGSVEVSGYAQVRNVLGRDNASTYSGSRAITRTVFEDRFERGLPRLPLVGLRMSF